MKFKSEFNNIQTYIDNFDPKEFSSAFDWKNHLPAKTEKIRYACKLKARLQRKKQMEESFLRSLEKGGMDDSDVTITQEQIDELLAAM